MTLRSLDLLSRHRFLLAPDGPSGGASDTPASSQGGSSGNSSASGSSGSPTPSGASSSPASSPVPSKESPAAPQSTTSESSPDTAVVTAPSGDSADFDFSSIFNDPGPDPSASPVVAPPTTAEAATAKPKDPASAEPPKKPEVEPKPATAAPAPETPATAQPSAAAGESPRFDAGDPLSLARGLAENENAAIEHVAATMFALSPEDVEALETDTIKTIPKLLARAVVKSQQQMFTTLARSVPLMIQRQTELAKRYSENEEKFFGAWPDLNRAAHGPIIKRLGAMYRQYNPDASLDQMVQELGPMVMAAAKVVPGTRPTGSPVAAKQNGVRPPQPFTPAQAGVVVGSQQAEAAPFDFLGQNE